jgi:hypothetical protein
MRGSLFTAEEGLLMSAWIRAVTLALLMAFPVPASAHWFGSRRVAVAGYYYPVPVTWAPAYQPVFYLPAPPAPVSVVVPPAAAAPPVYAAPVPAPPSDVPVVPIPSAPPTREPPRVTESRSVPADQAPVQNVAGERRGGPVRVGFWNVSDRDLVLRVDGRPQTLARGRAVTLSLGREFVWQVGGAEEQVERVPPDKSTLEIVIRR